MSCNPLDNNVNDIMNKTCVRYCPKGYKNYYSHCFKCLTPTCKDRQESMPEMEVREMDRHHQDFKITPNV